MANLEPQTDSTSSSPLAGSAVATERLGPAAWREQLPTLRGARVVLREMRLTDAASMLALLSSHEVSRFISTPPSTLEGFEQFIVRTRGQQALGRAVCYAVTLKGHDTAVGLFQVRETEAGFRRAEWGFALGSPFWGTGLFEECAHLVLDFTFAALNVHRLEARAAVRNGRGNRALRKLGAVLEGVLREAFFCRGEYLDQAIYGIVREDWQTRHSVVSSRVH